jgi:xanthosine utilization system XapX-like protein
MAIWFDNPLLRSLVQGLAVAVVLAAMAMMAFIAGVALLGAMIGLPVFMCLRELRRHLPAKTAWTTGLHSNCSEGAARRGGEGLRSI